MFDYVVTPSPVETMSTDDVKTFSPKRRKLDRVVPSRMSIATTLKYERHFYVCCMIEFLLGDLSNIYNYPTVIKIYLSKCAERSKVRYVSLQNFHITCMATHFWRQFAVVIFLFSYGSKDQDRGRNHDEIRLR